MERKPAPPRLTAAARRGQILDAARVVFMRSGFSGARIREISEVAGVNEALLYRHFSSKEELFEAAITEPLEQVVEELLRHRVNAAASIGSPGSRHALVVELMAALLDGMRRIAPLLTAVLFADGERGRDFYLSRIRPAIETLSDAIASVGEQWNHRDFDSRTVVISALATSLAIALDGSLEGGSLGARDEIARELANNLLYGLEARPGLGLD